MEEFIYYGELFNIYKELLKESNVEYFSLYYEENLTLQEIADLKGVSKSYVGNIINKTSKKLSELENILHLYKMKEEIESLLLENDIDVLKKRLSKLV